MASKTSLPRRPSPRKEGHRTEGRASIGLFLLLALTLLPAPGWADHEAGARLAFSEGERAFADNDYQLALERFRSAMELSPHDAVRFNVAVCLERLGRFREAYLEYQAASESAQLDVKSRNRAREQQVRVRERLALLVVAEPAGAELWVDGAAACVAPCEMLVDPKAHAVELRRGGKVSRASVELSRGETKQLGVDLGLDHRTASLPPPPPSQSQEVHRAGAGALTWIGAAAGVLGLAGFTGFGLRAKSLHDTYLLAPAAATRSEGVLMRDVANGSLVVGLVGVALVALDLVWLSRRPVP